MKKMVKVVLLFVAAVAVVGLSLKGNFVNLILDFENSGQFEWVDESNVIPSDFANSGQFEWVDEDGQTVYVDFANSGQFEWVDEDTDIRYGRHSIIIIDKTMITTDNGFENSGLPETIELNFARF